MAVALLVAAVLIAARTMPLHDPPREWPPVIGGLTPVPGEPDPKRGFLVTLSLSASGCGKPVKGRLEIAFPSDFVAKGRSIQETAPNHVLVGAVFSDPAVQIEAVQPMLDIAGPLVGGGVLTFPQWSIGLFANSSNPTVGRAAITQIPGWREHQPFVYVHFEADWTRPRGFKSCWLALPDTVGGRPYKLTLGSESEVAYQLQGAGTDAIAPASAPSLAAHAGRSDLTIPREIISGDGVPSLSRISLTGHLSVLDTQPQAPARLLGENAWRCPAPEDEQTYTEFGNSDEIVIVGEARRPLSQQEPACAGWVAVSEPHADTWRDASFLVAGTLFSLFAAMVVDAAAPRTQRSRPRDS